MIVIRTLIASAATAVLSVAGASPLGALPGDLDDTFGADGITEIPNATANADANGTTALAVGADSKLVQAGVDNGSGSDDEFIVVRYLDDGSPDPSFDGDGVARIADTTLQADVDGGVGVAVDSGNKAVLGGVSVDNGGEYFVARFGDSGGLDATYGAGGIAAIANATIAADFDSGVGLALKPDDRAALGGISTANSGEYFVAQYTTAGALDGTFGTGGIALIPNATINADENSSPALVVDFLSRTLLAGIAEGGGGEYFVSRFTAAGVLDTTFGTGGIVFIPNATINADENSGVGLAVRPDGSPVLGGIDQTGDLYFLAQFTNTGVLDTAFSGDGIGYLPGMNADQDSGISVTLQPDGKVLLGAIDETEREYTLSRFTSTGNLDPNFAAGGTAVVPSTSILADETSGVAVVLQDDGKPVLGGIDQTTTNAEEFFVARFDGDIASLDVQKAGPAAARPGDTVLYTITVTNTSSTESAFGVSLDDVLPPGMTINDIAASGDGSWTCVVSLATCDAPFLAPGDVAMFSVQATVDPGATAGVVTNTTSAGATNAFGTLAAHSTDTEILGDTPPEPPGPPTPPGPPGPPEPPTPPARPGPDTPGAGAAGGLDELPRTGPTGPLQLTALALAALLLGAALALTARGTRAVRPRSA